MFSSVRRHLPACAAGFLGFLALSSALSESAAALFQPLPSQTRTTQEPAPVLEPGKSVEVKFSDSEKKHSFVLDLKQGQYTTIQFDCPDLIATAKLADPSGTPIDATHGYNKVTKETIEVVAPANGRHALELGSTWAKGGEKPCILQIAPPRTATEKEASLQEARTRAIKGMALVESGKFDEGRTLLEKALELTEKLEGPEGHSVVSILDSLGFLYIGTADYEKAEEIYLRALKIQDKTTIPGNGQTYGLLNNLGRIYENLDKFDQAEQVLRRAIAIATDVYGADRPAVLNASVNLANVYDAEGDYQKAQEMFERVLAAGEKLFGPDYPGLSVVAANLSGVYSEKGDYLDAVRVGQRAVAILEKAGRLEDARLGLALVNLGDAYRFRGEVDKAEPLYDRALKIYQKKLGSEDPLIADNLSYLADIYRQRRDFTKAEAFYQRALTIREKKLGENNSVVGASLDSLGSLYSDQGDYARGEPLLRRALAIQQKSLGPENPVVAETLTHLAVLGMVKGDFVQAESALSQAIAISQHNSDLNLRAGSEREKLAYLELWSSQLDRAITLNASLAPDQAAARDLAITTVLQRKGRVQDVLAENLKTFRQRLNSDDAKLLDQFEEVTTQLARLVVGGPQHITPEENEKRISALREQRERLEAQISLRSAEFRAASQPVKLESVRAALPANSALIEFVSYQRLLPVSAATQDKGESHYIAYVLRSSGDVQWKDLGKAGDLDRAIDAYRLALRDPKRNDVNQLARSLDERIFQPLRPMLGDSTRLLISPDGQLSLIPFEALVDQQNQYAVEHYSINYISTGRDLLRMRVTQASRSAPLVIADPSFGEPLPQLASAARPDGRNQRRSVTTATDLSGVYFAPLDGTAQEARSIHAVFPDAVVLTGARASVAALKQAEAPTILHIATHGFFLQDPAQKSLPDQGQIHPPATSSNDSRAQLENPLLRSGLALARANLDKTGKDSGIMTALEASNLNLWGTKLVTLSACDTGVGEVRNGEGVYGLRRAFFLAGAETLVMSLWPVSDYVTREMMTSYYSGLKQGLGRGEALRRAQLAMLKRKDRRHPFYWASFIQSGEWANLDGQR